MTFRGTFLWCLLVVCFGLAVPGGLAFAATPGAPSVDIINGELVSPGSDDWSSNVAVLGDYDASNPASKFSFQFCSGVLVKPKWVLTSSSCASGAILPAEYVAVGVNDLAANEGEVIKVVGTRSWLPDDVGAIHSLHLLELERPATQGVPVALADGVETPLATTLGEIAGWGMDETAGFPTELHSADVEVFSDATCVDSYPSLDVAANFCAGHVDDEEPRDACVGDLGGPFMIDTVDGRRLAGINILDEACAIDNDFSIYRRVSPIASWIEWASTPGLSPSRSSLTFGPLLVGNGGQETASVSLTNDGGGFSRVGPISITGTAFSVSNTSCGNNLLAPGESCDLTVQFFPTVDGINQGELQIGTNRNDTDVVRLPLVGPGVVSGKPSIRVLGRPSVFKARKGPRLALSFATTPDLRGFSPNLMNCASDATVTVRFRGIRRAFKSRTAIAFRNVGNTMQCVADFGVNVPAAARGKRATLSLGIEPGPYFPVSKYSRSLVPKWFKKRK